ncbi:hypothetical protein LMG28138_01148 [Pararobbsia alpina]|uniref:Uncharacterized protein n=1 Tax=Pararobbsia alpina TaxID=621374 RepID=A0A6S7C4S1_9BURK|nr:hypothetical protein LMG28138_01148 [Pararobbsia alpina]
MRRWNMKAQHTKRDDSEQDRRDNRGWAWTDCGFAGPPPVVASQLKTRLRKAAQARFETEVLPIS